MKRALVVVLTLAAVAGGSALLYRASLEAVDPADSKRAVIQIPKGSSASDIAALLADAGLIRSALGFNMFVRFEGKAGGLQAGTFVFSPSMGVAEVVAGLESGVAEKAIVTIPEGYTVADIDALLAEKKLIAPGEVIECATTCAFQEFGFLPGDGKKFLQRGGRVEGYLFPETYYVIAEGFSAEAFLERLLSTFEERVLDELDDDIARSKRPLHEIVTMASLVEEETRTGEERPVVAGILWRRYDKGSGLGVDAAVRYVLNKPTGPLTVADLNDGSPYNLRKFRGLPPGPIASPGLASIRAVLHPTATEYWYYLHGDDGKIHYAITNEDHNVNRARFIR